VFGERLQREGVGTRTCGTEDNSTNNLCDDTGLPDFAERVSEELGHADDDHWERRKKSEVRQVN